MSLRLQFFSTVLLQIAQELRANKLRTFLSLLGITIGIFCIIAVLTVVDSLQNNINQRFSALGSDVLYVSRSSWGGDDGDFRMWEYLQRRPMSFVELDGIKRAFPALSAAALVATKRNQTLKGDNAEVEDISVYAVTETFERMQDIEIVSGRYFTGGELAGGANVAVIGPDVSEALFGSRSPIGSTIFWKGISLKVIGITKRSGRNMVGFNYDDGIICSYRIAERIFDLGSLALENNPLIMLRPPAGMNADELKDEVTGVLRSYRHVRPGGKLNFAVNQLSQITKSLGQAFGIIDFVGAFIGGLSIIVGMFGVANIMFVTVKERTKIIGLKRAIGATRRIIIAEFLLEAMLLCIIGGLIGIIAVLLLSFGLTHLLGFPVTLTVKNFSIGIVLSAAVGLFAGFVPARKASRLDPVAAIRTTG